MSIICRLFHWPKPHWNTLNEIPIWESRVFGVTTLGGQPTKEQLYQNPDKTTVKHIEPDLSFKLVGKLIEQRRKCFSCSYVLVKYQRFKI